MTKVNPCMKLRCSVQHSKGTLSMKSTMPGEDGYDR